MTKKELLKALEKFDNDCKIRIFEYVDDPNSSYYIKHAITEIEENNKDVDIIIECQG